MNLPKRRLFKELDKSKTKMASGWSILKRMTLRDLRSLTLIWARKGLPIGDDDEVVDFCMQYRIPQIEGLENCTNLKVSIPQNYFDLSNNFIGYLETGIEKEPDQEN